MTKKKITNNHSTQVDKPTKKVTYRNAEEYRDLFTFKLTPAPLSFIEKLASQLIAWARNDKDALVLEEFILNKGISKKVYYAWLPKYPILQNAHEDALAFLSFRREKGGLTRKLDSSMIQKSMPMYCDKWRGLAEWQSKLNSDDKNQGKIEVIIQQIPDSKIVPEKK